MATNRFGIDLAQIYQQKADLKGSQTRNKMASLQLGEAERKIAERPEKEAAAKKRNLMVTDLRQKAVGGDQQARDQLLVIDSSAKDFIDHIDQANDKQANQAKENIEQMGRMLNVVRNTQDPAQREVKYQQARSMLPKETQAKMSLNYSDNEIDLTLAKLGLMADVAEHKVLKFGGEDILYKDGKEIGRERTATKAPLVSVNTGGDKKESEKLAELRVKRLDEIQQKAIQAEESIEAISQIRAIDLDTGLGIETRGQIAKVWDAMGGDGKALTGVDPSDVQKFKAVALKQVLDVMASQKGPQTDQDAQRIEKTVASLGNTREANDFVLDAATSIANRKIEQAMFYENYLEENETVKGADAQWRDFKSKTPMVSDVIKDPESGRPLFFYQFKSMMEGKADDQGQPFSSDDITEAWRRMNIGAK